MTSDFPGREPSLILASASPRRRHLLASLGLSFTVATPDVDEAALAARHEREAAAGLAARLASAKAEALAAGVQAIVVAADTIVVLNDRTLGKPRSAAEAEEMLRALRGRPHTVITAVALRRAGSTTTDVASSEVFMRWYGDGEIERYIASGEPFDKAGGYAIQDVDFSPAVSLRGCYCNVVGLPLWRTARLLDGAGLQPAHPGLPQCAACPDAPHRTP